MGVTNAVTIDAEGIAPITLVGPGAGGMATASAVVADIADIARGVRAAPFGRPTAKLNDQQEGADAAPRGRLLHPHCSRVDKPGTAATIAKRLAQHNISMESIVQRHRGPPAGGAESGKGPVPVISDHLRDHRGCGAQGPGRGAARQGDFRAAAIDPHRKELMM